MDKKKIINRFLNIIYYSLNFITLPILYIYLFIHFDLIDYNFFENDPLGDKFFFTIMIPLIFLTWRLQWLIGAYFSSDYSFGLDFYKFSKSLNKLKSLTPEFNDKINDNKLDQLFKKYCLDKTISKIHIKKFPEIFRGGDLKEYTRIDKNLFNELYTYISDGVKITLPEQPPLYLITINNRFNICVMKYFEKKYQEEIKNRLKSYTEHENHQYDEGTCISNEITIKEYAIIMGTLIKYISLDKYNELLELHKNSEKIYDEYMLDKRLKK